MNLVWFSFLSAPASLGIITLGAKIVAMTAAHPLASLLDWYVAMGADEAIDLEPHDRTAPPAAKPRPLAPTPTAPRAAAAPVPAPAAPIVAPSTAVASAREVAERAQTLAELEAAVIRVDNGAYGKCEECGNPISEARLEAIPTARYCIEDQSKHDKNGRRNGR